MQIAMAEEAAFGGNLNTSLKAQPQSSGIGTIIFSLIFVICLIYITGIIYTRLNVIGTKTVKNQLKNCQADNIIVLSTLQLGQGKNLHVVETNGQKLLVGACANSINVIKDLGFDDFFKPKEKMQTVSETENANKFKEDEVYNKYIDYSATNSKENNEKDIQNSDDFELYKKYL
jgi:flagellar biogenesis protein FliO